MERKVAFCTCTDTKCPNNPLNHDLGCTPCVEKNLRQGEIPVCFFRSIDHPKPTKHWYYEDFAELVKAAQEAGKL